VGCIQLVQDAFAASLTLGLCTFSGFVLIGLGIAYLCWIEIRGYLAVRTIDRLASSLQSGNVIFAKRETTRWLHSVHQDRLIEEVQRATSISAIQDIVSDVAKTIDSKVDVYIAKESLLAGAIVGVSPWAFVDGIVVGWRQLKMMRQIATNYGIRPSTLGTLRLLKRVIVSVAFADAAEHISQWVASKVPSLGGIIPAAGQSAATAILTVRLGRSCKLACRPMQAHTKQRASLFARLKAFISRYKKTTAKEKRTRCSFNPGNTRCQTPSV